MKFLEQFEDYNKTHEILGVRIPAVEINKKYANDFGLDLSKDEHQILRDLCIYGYKAKGIADLPNKQEYADRIKFELGILKKLGFTRYILMVWDLIQWCDERDIARGWGRGSVGGSLVAYLLGLVAVDPVENGLIFERFINESRAKSKIIDGEQYSDGSTVPDIDLDISYLHRERVVKDYLEVKYPNRTAHISTLNTLSTKLVIKEVCKKYGGFDESEAGKISSMVDSDAGTLDSLTQTLEKSKPFKEWAEKNPDLFTIASKLLGLPKNFGVHAAGIIVSFGEVRYSLPLERKTDAEGNEKLVSSYTKDDVAEEEIKLDVLGLKTVDIIYNTARDVGFDISEFDVDSPEIYEYLKLFEHTYGIFQLDGDTACRVTRKVMPESLDDVAAISAIARPGALSFLDDFIEARATGKPKSIYPAIDEILSETSGVILYQEQTMRIANKVFGFSLLEADVLRKIIGKKQLQKVKEWEEKIKDAGRKKGIPEEATQLFWETVLASAKYQFNASHSYAYSYISVLCAYLKVNYPAAFFKNCLMLARTFSDSEARIMKICKELPHFGVEIKPPDLVESEDDFTYEGNVIRYGIKSIKSVSLKTLEKLHTFSSQQPNKFQLFEAAKESGINIGIMTNLIKAGCLNSFGDNRGRLMLEAATWNLLSAAQKTKVAKFGKKYDYELLSILFDIKEGKLLDGDKEIISLKKRKTPKNPDGISPWDTFYKKYEKYKAEFHSYSKNKNFYNYMYEVDILGFAYSNKLSDLLRSAYPQIQTLLEVEDAPVDARVTSCGIVQDVRMGKTVKGNAKLTIDIVDEFGANKLMMFDFERYDKNTHEKEWVRNVGDLEKEYGRLPEKKDIIVWRGTKKDRVCFADKIRVLNLEYLEKS